VLGGIGGLVSASLVFGLAHKMGPADVGFITVRACSACGLGPTDLLPCVQYNLASSALAM
jgi:hypothetical protein